ncbi:MAG: hypothetical protein IBX43_05095 [Campylobacterales bacterium]|nr:hypothetical protein [Campylobacterales bacterium]
MYEVKDGRVYISRAEFKRRHADYKIATKGAEMLLVNENGATVLAPVIFTERS